MLTQKIGFVVALLLLLPLCGTAMGQKDKTKTKFKRVIPWVQPPTKCETFEEFADGKKPPEIKAQFWKALGAKKPEEQRFADVKKIVAELPITKGGKRVTAATLEEAQNIVWDNYCFERMMSQRLRYLCCFWPFEDAKQAFFIDFQHKYSTAKPETRAKIDADPVTFFIKQASKENLTFADWELREALMQHICCKILLQQMESTKPGKLTDKDLAKFLKEQAKDIELEFAGKTVKLSEVFTDWEIIDTIIRFKNTMLINCMVDNVPAAEITKLGFEMMASQAEHLGALRLNGSQVAGHVAEMQRMVAKVGRIDRATRTAKELGDKPVLVMVGESHHVPMESNLETCLMRSVMENGPLIYFPEIGKPSVGVMQREKSSVFTKFFLTNIRTNFFFCKSLGVDSTPIDLYAGSERGYAARLRPRSVGMAEAMSNHLDGKSGAAFAIVGNIHLGHFLEPQIWNQLTRACVPITIYVYSLHSDNTSFECFDARNECPAAFNELRYWDIQRRFYPDKIESLAKTYCTDNTNSLAWKIRSCNNVDMFASKSMHAYPTGGIAAAGSLSKEQEQHLDEVREKMLAGWTESFGGYPEVPVKTPARKP